MMSMSFAPDGLGSADASKSAFLELGHGIPASQQHFSGLPTNVYPTHGLHSGGHPQHESPFPSGACHYGGPLGYGYPAPLNAPAPAPTYLPSYQQGSYRNPLSHTRNDETGECTSNPERATEHSSAFNVQLNHPKTNSCREMRCSADVWKTFDIIHMMTVFS